MKDYQIWLYIIIAVGIALTANSISTIWAKDSNKISFWLLALILISPIVFISFGLITTKLGLSITSGIIDSLLTITTITVGLVIFGEWNKISIIQYVGLSLSLCGIFLMVFFPKAGV